MVTATTTAELLERSVAGDRVAFERLFRPLYDDAFRLAAAMLSDASLAEDAVQESLFKAWRKLYTFRVGEDVRPWFLTIVANQCRSLRRTRWWSVQRMAEVDAPSRHGRAARPGGGAGQAAPPGAPAARPAVLHGHVVRGHRRAGRGLAVRREVQHAPRAGQAAERMG